MKKTVIILGIASLSALFSCGGKTEKTEKVNPLVFSTNIDDLQGWQKGENTFQKDISHSGIWGAFIDKKNPFSYGFEMPFKHIPSNNLTKVKFSAWVYKQGNNTTTDVCLDVRNPQDSCLSWQTKNINAIVTTEKTWTPVEYTFDINNIKKDEAKIKLFFWNSGADSTSLLYIDDINIEFLEK